MRVAERFGHTQTVRRESIVDPEAVVALACSTCFGANSEMGSFYILNAGCCCERTDRCRARTRCQLRAAADSIVRPTNPDVRRPRRCSGWYRILGIGCRRCVSHT